MKLFLIRHGETEHNKTGTILGWHDSKLTSLGIEQAESVAHKLLSKNIDIIISSDLGRAAQTATIISQTTDAEVLYDWLLRERYNGKLQGQPKHDVDWAVINADKEEARENQVESITSTIERGKAFVKNLQLLPHSASNVAVVSHSGFINAIVFAIDPNATYREIGNTEVVEVEISVESSSITLP